MPKFLPFNDARYAHVGGVLVAIGTTPACTTRRQGRCPNRAATATGFTGGGQQCSSAFRVRQSRRGRGATVALVAPPDGPSRCRGCTQLARALVRCARVPESGAAADELYAFVNKKLSKK